MAREYKLKISKTAKPHKPTLPILKTKDDIDYLPMHRESGEPFSFTWNETQLTGSVHRSWKHLTLIAASDGEFYVEDTKKPIDKQIRQLCDADRCTHCGEFFCTPECPNYHNALEYMSKQKILSVYEVLEIEPGDKENTTWINSEWEGVISGVKEAKGNGPATAIASQTTDPSVKITVNFWKVDPSEYEGKIIRFGGKGMKRSVYVNKFKKETQQVDVGNNTTFEIVGVSAHSDKPLPHPRSAPPDNGREPAERSSVQSGGYLGDDDGAIDQTPVNKRIFDYFKVMAGVVKGHSELKEKWNLPDFSPSDIKEITTGICMGYKGKYGVYRGPIFPKSHGATEAELAAMPEQSWEGDQGAHGSRTSPPKPQSTERKSSWGEFVHKKRQVKLSEIEDADLCGFARWARKIDPKKDAALLGDAYNNAFYANVSLMMAEKGWTSDARLLLESLSCDPAYDVEFKDADVDAYFGGPIQEMGDDAAAEILDNYEPSEDEDGKVDEGVIAGIIKQANANKKGSKKKQTVLPD